MSDRVLRVAFVAERGAEAVRHRIEAEVARRYRRGGVPFVSVSGGCDATVEFRRLNAPLSPDGWHRAHEDMHTTHAIVLVDDGRAVAVLHPGMRRRNVRPGEAVIVSELAKFLHAVPTADPGDAPWERSSEVLILHLHRLLQQKDALLERLMAVYEQDRAAAEARIAALEAQLAALEAERVRTPPRWRDPAIIGTIAVVVATLLGPVGGELVADALGQAHTVVVDCGLPPTPAAPAP